MNDQTKNHQRSIERVLSKELARDLVFHAAFMLQTYTTVMLKQITHNYLLNTIVSSKQRVDVGSYLRALSVLLLIGSACAPVSHKPGVVMQQPLLNNHSYLTADGIMLPVHSWQSGTDARSVIIALHGFNDYGNFFNDAGEFLASKGIVSYAYDQRGFGGSENPGFWAGVDAYLNDLATFVRLVKHKHSGLPIYLLGESMGGAVVLAASSRDGFPDVAGLILSAPAVWGRKVMPWYQRLLLVVSAHTVPYMHVTGSGLKIVLNVTPHEDTSGGGDVMNGTDANDTINALGGNDIIRGHGGNDNLFGGDGDDIIDGGSENDILTGNDGRDTLIGGTGDDDLFGNRGIDFLDPGLGQDNLDGGADFDRVSYAGSAAGVTVNLDTGIGSGGDAAGDTYIRLERITGSQFDDTITGNEFSNSLKGYGGVDIIFGLDGRDVIEGRNGDDTLHGGDKNDNILGGNDNDKLFGDAGFDKLFGELGDDELTGGADADYFVFNSSLGAFGGDVIMDFENGVDRLDVREVFSIANPANTADNFSDFTVSVSAGFGVKVKFENGQVIYLDDTATGITVADIDASDFIFA